VSEDYFQKFYKQWFDATKSFVNPWTPDSKSGESSTHFGFDKDWFGQSNAFFQRLLWFPPFSVMQGTAGPAIQSYAKYSEIVASSIELYRKWVKLYLEFSQSFAQANAALNARIVASGAVEPKEAYSIWIEEMTNQTDKILRNQETAKEMASFLSSLLDVKSQADNFMETYYRALNIPTKSELDRVYKEIYDLKKALRQLKKESSDSSEGQKRSEC
jgi:polyhydroxyalkanoate synthase subunit PhaE